jgi:uncharacterized protein (DUF2235 family)
MKRLIVCCDGTWNRPDHIDHGVAAPTNVAKLSMALAELDSEGHAQRLHYQPGVGTRRWEHLLGGGFGVGLSRNVQECYRFVVDNYEPGDTLHFFGFSRGAFTARSTVGVVRNCGILRPEERHRIEEAYALYRSPDKDKEPRGIAATLFRHANSHPDVDIDFIGVWDTVGALGIPIDGFRPPLLSRRWTFHDTTLSRRVLHAYHAVSIDERRLPFKPTLWVEKDDADATTQPVETSRKQTVEQVWFAGVHCDVGGGYREPELSEITLLWMAEKATACGLAFDPGRLVVAERELDEQRRRAGIELVPDPMGEVHNSRTRYYLLLPPYSRCFRAPKNKKVIGAWLASSAKTRYDNDPGYRPRGLKDWIDARRPVMPVREARSGERARPSGTAISTP